MSLFELGGIGSELLMLSQITHLLFDSTEYMQDPELEETIGRIQVLVVNALNRYESILEVDNGDELSN